MKKAEKVLARFTDIAGVRAAMLASADGLPMESVIRDEGLAADELAALARDVAAVARRTVKELDDGKFVQGLLEYSKGAVLYTNLPMELLLVVVAARNVNKAHLWNAAARNFADVVGVL
jgi:predicted regulator of Ras-like GTPase activity (Roadblock/LC7/MglB family)